MSELTNGVITSEAQVPISTDPEEEVEKRCCRRRKDGDHCCDALYWGCWAKENNRSANYAATGTGNEGQIGSSNSCCCCCECGGNGNTGNTNDGCCDCDGGGNAGTGSDDCCGGGGGDCGGGDAGGCDFS